MKRVVGITDFRKALEHLLRVYTQERDKCVNQGEQSLAQLLRRCRNNVLENDPVAQSQKELEKIRLRGQVLATFEFYILMEERVSRVRAVLEWTNRVCDGFLQGGEREEARQKLEYFFNSNDELARSVRKYLGLTDPH